MVKIDRIHTSEQVNKPRLLYIPTLFNKYFYDYWRNENQLTRGNTLDKNILVDPTLYTDDMCVCLCQLQKSLKTKNIKQKILKNILRYAFIKIYQKVENNFLGKKVIFVINNIYKKI